MAKRGQKMTKNGQKMTKNGQKVTFFGVIFRPQKNHYFSVSCGIQYASEGYISGELSKMTKKGQKKCQKWPKNVTFLHFFLEKGVKNDPKKVIFWWFFWPRSTFLYPAGQTPTSETSISKNGQKTSFLGHFLTPLFQNLFENMIVLFFRHIFRPCHFYAKKPLIVAKKW